MTEGDREREERFDALFKQYLPDIVAYCGWRARSQADAQDAVADVFLIAWRRLEELPAGKEARLWLYGAARRVLANQARADRRRERLSARVVAQQDCSEAVEGARAADPDFVDAVHAALVQLNPTDREILLLAEWEGFTPAEIAKLMGCHTVAARGRLFRARRRFRQVYEALPERPCHRLVECPSESALGPQCALADQPTRRSRSTEGVVPCS